MRVHSHNSSQPKLSLSCLHSYGRTPPLAPTHFWLLIHSFQGYTSLSGHA
ncbi:hypothetical protein HanXRQr2_Chr02g0054931 [Helianthus annuus]|uniref:Uncharacterized protein n=1 Tax=Helianthus annuus TaxID=4232 RepID=A0A9K3JNB5_HELAN|nr:hypothetical protein HanXRQr2_Chr02g0054931 [Helianthus annuus]